MEILRVFNNNVVLARSSDRGDVVLSGRGLGFQAKPGMTVDESKVVRVFIADDGRDIDNFAMQVSAIPPEHLQWADEALEIARGRLPGELPATTIIAVADHLSFALKRVRMGVELEYPLRAEVAHLYPEELAVAEEVLSHVNRRTDVPLPDGEAVAIAMHLVNAGFTTGDLSQTYLMTGVFTQIFDVLEQVLGTRFDRDSVTAARFITHLRYFFVRANQGKQFTEQVAGSFAKAIRESYPEAYGAAVNLRQVLELRLGQPVTDDEVSYLTIHIARLAGGEQPSG